MGRLAPYQLGALATTATSVVAVGVLSWGRSERADHTLVATAWIVGMLAVLVAAGAAESLRRLPTWRPTRCWYVAGAIVAVAFVLRIVRLDRFPRIVDSDGMGFALFARAIANGEVRDPFTTGYLDHPILWSYGQRAVMLVTGETLAGARTLSAVVGTAAVAATIAWGRRIGGWSVGLIAGAFLAASPMHLLFSRLALNNVVDSLALPLVLVLLDRGVVDHRRPAAVAAGLVLGLAQYGYFGARVLLPIVALVGLTLVVRARRHGSARAAAQLLGWVGIGAAVAVMPLALHYVEEPGDLTARDEQVSIFSGWLEAESAVTGDSQLRILGEQVVRAVLLPALDGQQAYHPPAPLVGWPLLVGSAIGLGVVLAGLRRDRHCVALAVAWLVPLVAISTTIGLYSHRWVIGTPVVATTAAIGLVAIGRALAAGLPQRSEVRALLAGSAVAVTMAVGAVHAGAFYRESNAIEQHADLNSLVATELADVLEGEAPGTRVLLAFTPRMGARSHHTVPFLAPHVDATDLTEPLRAAADVPDAPPGTLFGFLPERRDELEMVRLRHPGGEERAVVVLGYDLFTLYRIPD